MAVGGIDTLITEIEMTDITLIVLIKAHHHLHGGINHETKIGVEDRPNPAVIDQGKNTNIIIATEIGVI